MYFDPPYAPASDTADFTQYVSGGFDASSQELLLLTCLKLHQKGVRWETPVSHDFPSFYPARFVRLHANSCEAGGEHQVTCSRCDARQKKRGVDGNERRARQGGKS